MTSVRSFTNRPGWVRGAVALAVGAAVVTSAGVMGPAQAAQAADTAWEDLRAAAASCTDGNVLALVSDAAAGAFTTTPTGEVAERIEFGCSAVLDLAGHTLTSPVKAFVGGSLTIRDSVGGGALIADLPAGGFQALSAAIENHGAHLIIESGTIRAVGVIGAGIGGSAIPPLGSSGPITITGGTVTAETGEGSARIGPGMFASDLSGPITIAGGIVNAVSERESSWAGGIGSATSASIEAVTVTGGVVNVHGSAPNAALGAGSDATSGPISVTGGEVHVFATATGIGGSNGAVVDGDITIGGNAIVDVEQFGGGAGIGVSSTNAGQALGNITIRDNAQVTTTLSRNVPQGTNGPLYGLRPGDGIAGGLIGMGSATGNSTMGNITITGEARVTVEAIGSATPGALIGTTSDVHIGERAVVDVQGNAIGAGIGRGMHPQDTNARTNVLIDGDANVNVDLDVEFYGASWMADTYPQWSNGMGVGIGIGDGNASGGSVTIGGNANVTALGNLKCGIGVGGQVDEISIRGSAVVDSDGVGSGGCARDEMLQRIEFTEDAQVTAGNRARLEPVFWDPGAFREMVSDAGGVTLGAFTPEEVKTDRRPEIFISGNASVTAVGQTGAGIGTGLGLGHALFAEAALPRVVIDTTGNVTADSVGGKAAGIGSADGVPIEVDIRRGGTVEASASGRAAAIGGSVTQTEGAHARITIGNATVIARQHGGTYEGAPAIGAGEGSTEVEVVLGDGAVVTAHTASVDAPAIGHFGENVTVTIGKGAVATAEAGPAGDSTGKRGPSALGGAARTLDSQGAAATATVGSWLVDGTLILPEGALLLGDDDRSSQKIGPTGVIRGTDDADPTVGGKLAAAHPSRGGTIVNEGVIALTDVNEDDLTVSVNNTLVSYDVSLVKDAKAPAPVRVYAPKFEGSFRELAAAPTKREWVREIGKELTAFDSGTVFSGEPTVKLELRPFTVVTPPAPTLNTDVACDVPLEVIVPKETGIEYTVTQEGDVVTVTAVAAFGYEIAAGQETRWEFNVKAVDCEKPDPEKPEPEKPGPEKPQPVKPTPEKTPPAAVVPALSETGGTILPAVLVAAALGTIGFLLLRRKPLLSVQGLKDTAPAAPEDPRKETTE